MRFVSLLVAFCFSLNVMASTGSVQELEKQLDDYHYALSVDWDQKDQAFYEAKTNEFFGKLQTLIKNDGLSKEQIMTLVENKVGNKEVVNALRLKLSLLAGNASPAELAEMIKASSKDFYAQGASWSGEVLISVGIGLVVAAIIGYSIWWDANHECVAYENQYVCNTYNNCQYNNGGYYGSGNYGGGYNSGYCYGTAYTTCGYVDVCTDYAKK